MVINLSTDVSEHDFLREKHDLDSDLIICSKCQGRKLLPRNV